MSTYYTPGPRKGPNGKAPAMCADIDHECRTITDYTFCVRCNLPWRCFLGADWPWTEK